MSDETEDEARERLARYRRRGQGSVVMAFTLARGWFIHDRNDPERRPVQRTAPPEERP